MNSQNYLRQSKTTWTMFLASDYLQTNKEGRRYMWLDETDDEDREKKVRGKRLVN